MKNSGSPTLMKMTSLETTRLILRNKFKSADEILEIWLEAENLTKEKLNDYQINLLKKHIFKIVNKCNYCKAYEWQKCKQQFHLKIEQTPDYITTRYVPCKRYVATEQGQKLNEQLKYWEWHHRQIGLNI